MILNMQCYCTRVLYLMKSYHVTCILLQDGSTALHKAAWRGNTEVLEMLIKLGADVNACDDVSRYLCDEMSRSVVSVTSKKYHLM